MCFSDLAASFVSGDEIDLSWTPDPAAVGDYEVDQWFPGTGWAAIDDVGGTASSYAVPGPFDPSTAYQFRLDAYDTSGNAAGLSNAAAVTTPAVPDAPSNLNTLAVSDSRIDLAWQDNSTNETGFTIQRSADGYNWTQLATVGPNVTAYSDGGLNNGTLYYYRVSAANAAGESSFSGVAAAQTPYATPTIATAASASQSTVTGTTDTLRVLGAVSGGTESSLIYVWSVTSGPSATFSPNYGNSAKNATVTFSSAGDYTLQVSIQNGTASVTSSVQVTVNQTLKSVLVTAPVASVLPNDTVQLSAVAQDQFTAPMSPAPTVTWSVTTGEGGVNTSGLYTAGPDAGVATVQATTGTVSGQVQISTVIEYYKVTRVAYADGDDLFTGDFYIGNTDWIEAASPQDAIRKAVSGTVVIRDDGDVPDSTQSMPGDLGTTLVLSIATGLVPGNYSGTLTVSNGDSTPDSWSITVVQKPTVDLLVDSNNDGAISPNDEPHKDDASVPGKVIIANTLDDTGNHIPGYADFSSTSALAPAEITLSDNIDLSKAIIKFEYSSASPLLVSHTSVPGTDIPRYDPGSNGELRLWDTLTARRNTLSVPGGGDYIPDGVSIPASDLFKSGLHSETIYMEGINPGDPNNTRIAVMIDPDGQSGFVDSDAVRVTVSRLQIVYTDVSGITHNTGDPEGMLAVPRISSNLEPQGIATDWMNGVDDGSSLLVRAVASPVLAGIASQSGSNLRIFFGESYAPSQFQSDVKANDGYLHGVEDGFVNNPDTKLTTLGIENIGQQWGSTGLMVINARFYRPPNEFDLADSTDTARERRVPLAVEAILNGTKLDQGAKPAALTLTRPPLVLVHGMNSGPGAWDSASGGGQSFNQAASTEYPHTFAADYSGVDPANPSLGQTFGEGEIADMYKFVEQTIGQATNAYRSGTFFNGDPYAPANPNNPGVANAVIAVQKVDAVAHSYGGLVTRWYIEQSGDFEARRDVRKVIELGTPNLGSPLANMVDEIYRNPIVANAEVNVSALSAMSLMDLILLLDNLGKSGQTLLPGLPSNLIGTISPFFEDASVNSQRMTQLDANPFNSNVGYAAVVGTQSVFADVLGLRGLTNLYDDVQPMSTNGLNYFPWLNIFDGSQTDTIVPMWSASLGVSAYNFQVPAIHTGLPQNVAVQAQVLAWLSDPNVPLGSAQAAAWHNQPPVNDRNAYQGAVVQANGSVYGGGLNPDAIIGVSFAGTGMNPVTWGTSAAEVGIKRPILTGMIKVGDIGSKDFVVGGAYLRDHSLPLQDLGLLGRPALNIDSTEFAGAGLNDWVAFHVAFATIGRRHDPVLTGPSGQSDSAVYGVDYTMSDLPDGKAPPTQVTLPGFTLDTPTNVGTKVFVTGAVESSNSAAASQTTEVDLYAKEPVLVPDTELAAFTFSVAHPTGTWDGVLLPYSDDYQLVTDMLGNVFGNEGNSGENHPLVYQYLIEPFGVSNGQSQPVQL